MRINALNDAPSQFHILLYFTKSHFHHSSYCVIVFGTVPEL